MKWQKLNPYCIQSDCGGYRISKMLGPPIPPVYLAWKRKAVKGEDGKWYPNMIGKADSSEGAIAICKADAEARRTAA